MCQKVVYFLFGNKSPILGGLCPSEAIQKKQNTDVIDLILHTKRRRNSKLEPVHMINYKLIFETYAPYILLKYVLKCSLNICVHKNIIDKKISANHHQVVNIDR